MSDKIYLTSEEEAEQRKHIAKWALKKIQQCNKRWHRWDRVFRFVTKHFDSRRLNRFVVERQRRCLEKERYYHGIYAMNK